MHPQDRTHIPDRTELAAYIQNPLFDTLVAHLDTQYHAKWQADFSGDKNLPGWNMRFAAGGRTLCRVYPRVGYFTVLLVIGRKEQARTEALLPQLSDRIQTIYRQTKEGMGQRWLLMDFADADASFDDLLQLIAIRRQSK